MKRLLVSIAVLALIVAPQFVLGSDLEELKAFQEQMNKAYNSLDAATIASMIYPGSVMFTDNSATANVAPMESTEAILRTALNKSFAALESLTVTPVNMQYRVVGNTAILWGYQTIASKPKDGPLKTRQIRVTYTLIKSGGKWSVLLGHESAIPSGD